jgi:hypothetical protein
VAVFCSPFRAVTRDNVLLPTLNPVGGDAALRVGERHFAGANFRMELVLKLILFTPSWPGRVRLRS